MNLIDLTIDNWDEFINQSGKKIIIISNPRCDCNRDVFYDFFNNHNYENLSVGIMISDIDTRTGQPSRIINMMNISNILDIINSSPSIIVYDGDEFITAYTGLDDGSTEDDRPMILSNLIRIMNKI